MTESNYDRVSRLAAWAKARGRGVNELAQAWLLAQPPVCSVISGATKPEQVVSNVKASDWQLTAEELKEVDAIIKLY
jgi:aryl-alcohol dehydrogenase-like predicted oxidoreductase